ncbi:hypothetical protein [Streptomyces sp. NPDC059010]|uniref:hypothetical protein n=1 Tax=Streptomyces sp. NPDC059010 TaxID=3346695 RepID=UPI0036B9F4FE
MKTDANGRPNLRKVGTGVPGVGPAAAKRGVGSRIGAGAVGIFFVFFGLVLIASGYEEGPAKVRGATQGTVTIERCGKDVIGDDVECSGTFRPDDGGARLDVEDFEPGADRDRGEEVQAVADRWGSFRPGSFASYYVEAVRFWCVGTAMFGVAIFPLSAAVRSGSRPIRRGTRITALSLLFGGLLGCGLCVFVSSVFL